MRLADFIAANTEPILAEWVAFAASCNRGASMDRAGLRDHALEMLRCIVQDLRTPQTERERKDKSLGNSDSTPAEPDTAAEVHAMSLANLDGEYALVSSTEETLSRFGPRADCGPPKALK